MKHTYMPFCATYTTIKFVKILKLMVCMDAHHHPLRKSESLTLTIHCNFFFWRDNSLQLNPIFFLPPLVHIYQYNISRILLYISGKNISPQHSIFFWISKFFITISQKSTRRAISGFNITDILKKVLFSNINVCSMQSEENIEKY